MPRHVLEPRIQFRRQAEDALGVLEHHAPRLGERNPALAALENARVEVFFELLDLKRDRWLRHEQHFGRLGEREVFRDRVKDLEAPVGHSLFKHKRAAPVKPGRAGRRCAILATFVGIKAALAQNWGGTGIHGQMEATMQAADPSQPSERPSRTFPIVCVGGSAGGLDAYIRLLKNLPADLGVAIVIVNHITLLPTQLHTVLPRFTTMPVDLITDRLSTPLILRAARRRA